LFSAPFGNEEKRPRLLNVAFVSLVLLFVRLNLCIACFSTFEEISTTDGPGPILELLNQFKACHVKFLEGISELIPGFQAEDFNIIRSSNMSFYYYAYKATLDQVIY
jgi:hypothetical protein